MQREQPCAGGIVFDAGGRLLMIRRGTPPAQGSWSLPGGRCHVGESPADACVREVAEETGLTVEVVRHAGRVERAAPGGGVYVIDDFVCVVRDGGEPTAGDDAADARWVDAAALAGLETAPGLLECLRDWELLPG